MELGLIRLEPTYGMVLIRLEPTYGAGFNQTGAYIWS